MCRNCEGGRIWKELALVNFARRHRKLAKVNSFLKTTTPRAAGSGLQHGARTIFVACGPIHAYYIRGIPPAPFPQIMVLTSFRSVLSWQLLLYALESGCQAQILVHNSYTNLKWPAVDVEIVCRLSTGLDFN